MIVSTPGKIGHQRQAQAVANRLALPSRIVAASDAGLGRCADEAALVLAAGRQAIAPARRIARRPAPRPVVAVLQPVVWRPNDFDLIWTPLHDRHPLRLGRSHNRIETLTAPSPFGPEEVAAAIAATERMFAGTRGRRVGVLVGGPSAAYRFGIPEARELAGRLAAFASTHETSLLVSTSRRTPRGVQGELAERFAAAPHVFVAAGAPGSASAHAAILGLSDAFVVTADSVAMLSEAAATGKPVYGWRLPGGRAKFDRFHDALVRHGALRWFDGGLNTWTYPRLDAAAVIAGAIAPLVGLLDAPHRRI